MASGSNYPFPSSWHLKKLLGGFGVAVLLAASYWWGPSAAWWRSLDEQTFYVFNGWLADESGPRFIWAFANTKLFDLIAGIILMLPFLCFIRQGKETQVIERCAMGLFIAIIVFTTIFIVKFLAPYHPSPSLVLTPLWDLELLVPELNAKVYAGSTFPSDHGMTVLMLTAFVWHFAGWRYGLAQLLLAILFCMPRLVSGAHWLTDSMVGSLLVTLVVTSVMLATPLGSALFSLCLRLLQRPKIAKLCHFIMEKIR